MKKGERVLRKLAKVEDDIPAVVKAVQVLGNKKLRAAVKRYRKTGPTGQPNGCGLILTEAAFRFADMPNKGGRK